MISATSTNVRNELNTERPKQVKDVEEVEKNTEVVSSQLENKKNIKEKKQVVKTVFNIGRSCSKATLKGKHSISSVNINKSGSMKHPESISDMSSSTQRKRKFNSSNQEVGSKKLISKSHKKRTKCVRFIELSVRHPEVIEKTLKDGSKSKAQVKKERKDRRKESKRQQAISSKLEIELVENRLIDDYLLKNNVVVIDNSSKVKYTGDIIRCFYSDYNDDQIRWKITLSGNLDLIVDTDTCEEINEGTKTNDFISMDITKPNNVNDNKKTINNYCSYICSSSECKESTYCLFCGVDSKNKRKNPKLITTYVDNKSMYKYPMEGEDNYFEYIQCSQCLSKCCITCIESLCYEIKKNKDEKNDDWYIQVNAIMDSKQQNPLFIGHCCELKNKIERTMESSKGITDDYSELKYDGYLHIPQLHILLDTPLVDYVDIHGLGKEDVDHTPGLIHGVVSKECAKQCHILNVNVDLVKTNTFDICQDISYKDIYGESKSLSCCIQILDIDQSVDTKIKRHHEVTVNDIEKSSIIKHPNNCDVWIILAKLNKMSNKYQLVNMRWKSYLDSSKWTDNSNVKIFYNDLLDTLDLDGYDAKRSGGSNGLTTLSNYNILKLLRTNDAFIRKGKGVKVIKKDKKWVCYYLKSGKGKDSDDNSKITDERSFTKYSYSQPQCSGNFEMNKEIMDKYMDVVTTMTEAKYNSSLLIKTIDSVFNFQIQEGAVKAAIEDITRARLLVGSELDEQSKKNHFIRQLAMDNLYTLVAYPCNYHYDVFKKGQYSLENKICFSFYSDSNDIGRGGNGPCRYVFALLDWTNSGSGRRRRQYIASGAELSDNQVVTRARWERQFGNNI